MENTERHNNINMFVVTQKVLPEKISVGEKSAI